MSRLFVSWSGVALLAACSSPAPVKPDAPRYTGIDPVRFSADLATIAQPRVPDSPHWQVVQDLCAERFESLGFTVERHRYTTGVNVIGVLPGTRLPAERVVVSAHYDSVNACPGADDNASGVAGLFEVARVLATRQHARTLVVACWDEEESGLIGSRAYVQRAVATNEDIVASFVFDTMTYRNTAPNSQRTDPAVDAAYPDQTAAIAANEYRGDFVLIIHDDLAAPMVAAFESVAAAIGLPTIALPVPASFKRNAGGLRRSDHARFWDADFPALLLTDTADFRNAHYHCIGGSDVVEDVDVEFATQILQATTGAAETMLDR